MRCVLLGEREPNLGILQTPSRNESIAEEVARIRRMSTAIAGIFITGCISQDEVEVSWTWWPEIIANMLQPSSGNHKYNYVSVTPSFCYKLPPHI